MTEASVVICAHTLDRWDELNAAVASVHAQTRPAREIYVVTDYNEVLRERAESEIEGVRVVPNTKEPGLSGGRMTGADLVTAEVVAFLDDDAIADPRWLEELLQAYENPNVLGAGGSVEPMWRELPPSWFPGEFGWVIGCTYNGMPVQNGRIRNPIGANMSVRREVLYRAGGFASQMGRQKAGFSISSKAKAGGKAESCEETEFCIRAARLHPGGYFAYRPGARVQHIVPAQRGTWRYFVHRCLVEGTAKGVLTDLTGTKDGLSSEGRYVREVLPQAVMHNLGAAMRGDTGAARRALVIVAGLVITAFAYGKTRVERRRSNSARIDAVF
ncbi:glycosyltransferase family 2 protein [Methylobacterium nodulans]|uniref:Glycosyl transferase family 2 n=1 Tax=Methylobacterium nodulans (strain LMG 21967 / CNCM I-2342 / ORS 2060) TaxID=460265 RepID=B8IGC5_METNO|nr:glycosyltransferase family 2 protein [Methylobacterium nodulans]ACL61602.1 glycosyl transferase family 2 [Methylobacterium nodulans ORS 2060]